VTAVKQSVLERQTQDKFNIFDTEFGATDTSESPFSTKNDKGIGQRVLRVTNLPLPKMLSPFDTRVRVAASCSQVGSIYGEPFLPSLYLSARFSTPSSQNGDLLWASEMKGYIMSLDALQGLPRPILMLIWQPTRDPD
jgi:hypothetical protein